MREVGVHDDDKVACDGLQAVDVGGAEPEFAGSRAQDYVVGAEGFLEGFGALEGAVGRGVVDYYYFPVEVSVVEVSCESRCVYAECALGRLKLWARNILSCEDIVEHLHQHGQILALIVGW